MLADPGKEWLLDARGDLALATVNKTRAMRYAHLCFHAQQAAEKSLKAVYLALDLSPPKTHDLAYLMDNLPDNVVSAPSMLMLPVLTKYAVQCRYPGQEIPVNRPDWLTAVELAKETYRWAKRIVNASATLKSANQH